MIVAEPHELGAANPCCLSAVLRPQCLASPIISTPSKLLAIFRIRAPLFSTVSELFRQKTPGVGTPSQREDKNEACIH
jgi:hypothetical protein